MDSQPAGESRFERFRRSAKIDLEKWRDPTHDLEAILGANAEERDQIEQFLLARGIQHVMDVQALALLDTEAARMALVAKWRSGPPEIRAAVVHFAPTLVGETEKLDELVGRIGECDVYDGLDLTLQQIEINHPPQVVLAMLQRIARDPGVVAVHFAAMLLFIRGQASEPFDWEQRPFFLRFGVGDEADRQAALRELSQRIGVQFPA
ncbi:MAG: hypothetical protein JNL67_22535 [Planctomycetaceae bacterium]|nr:hypothetical protein [Planctomycetaceae bacterium]